MGGNIIPFTPASSTEAHTKKAVVIVCRCPSCNPKNLSLKLQESFLARLRLKRDDCLFYPVAGGANAVATNGVAKSLKVLVDGYQSIKRVVIITSANCQWYQGKVSTGITRGFRSVTDKQIADLMVSVEKIDEAFEGKIGVELYHDKGHVVPERIPLA